VVNYVGRNYVSGRVGRAGALRGTLVQERGKRGVVGALVESISGRVSGER
jgi:hypothetical protein